MILIATKSFGKFLVTGIIVLPAAILFGFLSLLGSVLGLDAVERALRTDWSSFSWSTDGLFLSGIGGTIGLVGLSFCWFAVLWPGIAHRYGRLLLFTLLCGVFSASLNIILVASHLPLTYLLGLISCVALAFTFGLDILRLMKARSLKVT